MDAQKPSEVLVETDELKRIVESIGPLLETVESAYKEIDGELSLLRNDWSGAKADDFFSGFDQQQYTRDAGLTIIRQVYDMALREAANDYVRVGELIDTEAKKLAG